MGKLAFLLVFTFQGLAFSQSTCPAGYAPKALANGPKITLISGTNRSDSNSLKVALKLKDKLEKQGSVVTLLDLEKVPPSTYSSKNYWNTPKAFRESFDQPIADSDAVIVIVPEYHGSFPGILKTFFDYVQAPLTNKPISLVGISAGMWGARSPVAQFVETLVHRKAQIISAARLNIQNVETEMNSEMTSKRMDDLALETIRVANQENEKQAQALQILKLLGELKRKALTTMNSGMQVSSVLAEAVTVEDKVAYLKFSGPTQLLSENVEIPGQGADVHNQGFGMPVGELKGAITKLSDQKAQQVPWLKLGKKVKLNYKSGVSVKGTVKAWTASKAGQIKVITFESCLVTLEDQILFDPSWGNFDLLVAEKISAVSEEK